MELSSAQVSGQQSEPSALRWMDAAGEKVSELIIGL
jgi:hypothetical protein